jgi:Cu2+-exporting ATPase
MPVCDHCLLEVSEREAVVDEINGQRKVFCCHACNGIYRLIRNEGLEEFYNRRKEWSPGPAEDRPVDIAAFTDNLRPAGKEIETDIVIDGIRCASCVWLNEKILLRTKGISYAMVNYATHRAKLRWDPVQIDLPEVLSRIRSIGYTPKPFLPRAWEDEQKRQSRDLLVRFGTAAFFSMQLMLFSMALYAGYFQGMDKQIKLVFHLISFALTTPVLFYSGWPIMRASFRGLRNLTFNMDVLIAAGALSAYGYSIYALAIDREVYFDTAAMIVTLILLGRYIEAGAKGRASETITRLMQLSPREARRLENTDGPAVPDTTHGARTMVPLAQIRPGELLEVIPGERIPLDGELVSGASEADESMLTGESKPAAKTAGSTVFGGTVNLYGSFIFRVTRVGKETVLSRIVQAVEDAQSRRAPIQSVADRVVGYFVPAVLLISLFTLFGWLWQGAPLHQAVMNAVSVMVIACPCALGLATPLAILIGTSHAAARGILIKGGDVIEKAGRVNEVMLDKTGTITEGKPVLSQFAGIGISEDEALRIALSLERRSEHSLGKAIVDAAKGLVPCEVLDFTAVPGKGVKGIVDGKPACIGSRNFVESEGIANRIEAAITNEQRRMIEENERSGATIVYLSRDSVFRGVFIISDQLRKEAPEAIGLFRKAGVGVTMVTGDNENTAQAVAQRTGIGQVKAQVSPMDKAAAVRQLQASGRKVLMAGDGINDAPALVQADVGVAMGRATDIALESADMVIMRPDLRLIPQALALSKKTLTIIRQNIFWAFFYNLIVIPLAIAGVLHPIIAAGAMAFSSLSVVGNSLRAKVT